MESDELQVYFSCVKEGGKLRVRITSPGYHHEANCQFPRAIRAEGKIFSAPVSAVKFARGPAGKFFYRVAAKKVVEVLGLARPNEANEIAAVVKKVKKIYEEDSEECIICFSENHEVVVVPCGHFCMCGDCADKIKKSSGKCPVCRGDMELVVTRDQIQT